jgi:hypothetical protein
VLWNPFDMEAAPHVFGSALLARDEIYHLIVHHTGLSRDKPGRSCFDSFNKEIWRKLQRRAEL